MEIVINLVVWLIFGVACALIANSRGRNPLGWFFIGVATTCIGLILVLVLPDLRVQQERENRLKMENRRLKERIRKDRLVADQRHEEISGRLRVHDRALGVETDASQGQLGMGGAGPAAQLPVGGFPDEGWHYAIEDKVHGPVTLQRLRGLWGNRFVVADTMVWYEGLSDWTSVKDLEGLADELNGLS